MSENTKGGVGTSAKVKAAIGFGAAGLAGAYYLYGTKEGRAKRKEAEEWLTKAKTDIAKEVSTAKVMTEEVYDSIVDTVLKKYESIKGIEVAELIAVGSTLKAHWSEIKARIDKEKKKAVTPKKTTRTTKSAISKK